MIESPPPARLARTVVTGATLAVSGFVLTQGLMLAAYVVLAHVVSPRDLGHFAAGSLLASFGLLFAGSGISSALIQRRDRVEEAASTAVVATLAGGVALSLVALATSPLIGLLFESRQVAEIAAVMSGWILVHSFAVVPGALMARRFSFVRRLVIEPLGALAFGVVSVVACARGLGAWGLVAGSYALAGVWACLSWALLAWRADLRLASMEMWRELVAFGRPVIGAEFLRRIGEECGTVLIGAFLGPAALGAYYYARRVALQPVAALVHGVSYVVYPAFAHIAGDAARLREGFLRSLRWMSAISLPLGLLLVPLGPPLVTLVLGARWDRAGVALAALAGYAALQPLISLAGEAVKAMGRPALLLRIQGTAAALTVGLMCGFVAFGVTGVAVAASAASAAVCAYAVLLATRALGVAPRDAVRGVAPPAMAALATTALVVVSERFADSASRGIAVGLALVAAEAAGAAAVYAALLWRWAPDIRQEIRSGAAFQRFRVGSMGGPRQSASARGTATL